MKKYGRIGYGKTRRSLRGAVLFGLPALMLAGLLVWVALCPSRAGAEGDNLLINGSFETLDDQGQPVGWREDAYLFDEGYTVFAVSDEAADGERSVTIRNIGENDARYAQTVAVEPESLYRFSGYIKTEAVEDGRGANLSVEGLYTFSDSVYDTSDGWQYIEWYGETDEDQRSVTLFARLGGYSGESLGQAWFDGLRLEKVSEVPGSEIAALWYSSRVVGVYEGDGEEEEPSSGTPAWPMLIVSGLLYSLAAVLIFQGLRRKAALDRAAGRADGRRYGGLFGIGLAAAFVLRLALSYVTLGYMVDVNCFMSWGGTMAKVGPVGFYPETSFCDYPPAYTYVLGLNSLICGMIPGISEGMTRVVFRFFPALCDVLTCLALDWYLRRAKPETGDLERRAGLLLLAFHPVTVINSACWGQMDSALALLLLLVAIWAIEDRWELAFPCYMLSVLVKPQALMLGFLGLLAAILVWIRKPEVRRRMIGGLIGAAAVALIVVVPFSLRQDPFWIISQYGGTLSSYPYAAVNTANFYYLFDGNWDAVGNPASAWACAALAALAAGYGAALYARGKTAWRRAWIEPALAGVFCAFFAGCGFWGLSWAVAGAGAMAFAFLVTLGLFLRKGDMAFLPYMGGLLFLILYVFGIKMHERYIFPAFLLLALAFGLTRDRRIGAVFLGITVTAFLNEGIVLDNSIRLGSSMGHLNADTKALAMIAAAVNCLLTLYAVGVGIDLAAEGEKEARPKRGILSGWPAENRLCWRKADTLALCLILAAYSAVTFTTLGSRKAPQTAWTSSVHAENVVLDLGENREDFTMLYFARVSRYNFSVSVSPDGETWEEDTWAQLDQGQCWKWKAPTARGPFPPRGIGSPAGTCGSRRIRSTWRCAKCCCGTGAGTSCRWFRSGGRAAIRNLRSTAIPGRWWTSRIPSRGCRCISARSGRAPRTGRIRRWPSPPGGIPRILTRFTTPARPGNS